MNKEKFSEAMSDISDAYIEEAASYQVIRKKFRLTTWKVLAACLAVFLLAQFLQPRLPLSDGSSGVTVRRSILPFHLALSITDSVLPTAEEMFYDLDTAIFRGTVIDIQNILMDFGGASHHRALAEIRVEEVYRGAGADAEILCEPGATVTVLLPYPVALDINSSLDDHYIKLKTGATGIFMPLIYDEDSIRMENGAALRLLDIAEYGFYSGRSDVFLETTDGLKFDAMVYPDLAGATTLDEVESYIQCMLAAADEP